VDCVPAAEPVVELPDELQAVIVSAASATAAETGRRTVKSVTAGRRGRLAS
jgi:hypothetical protein